RLGRRRAGPLARGRGRRPPGCRGGARARRRAALGARRHGATVPAAAGRRCPPGAVPRPAALPRHPASLAAVPGLLARPRPGRAGAPVGRWDRPTDTDADDAEPDLFDTLDESVAEPLDAVPELRRQLDAVAGSAEPGRLRLLLAAESAGALVAAEMHHDGLPWSAAEHDR